MYFSYSMSASPLRVSILAPHPHKKLGHTSHHRHASPILTTKVAQIRCVRHIFELNIERFTSRQTGDVAIPETILNGHRFGCRRCGRGRCCCRRYCCCCTINNGDTKMLWCWPSIVSRRTICNRHSRRLVDGFLVARWHSGKRNMRSSLLLCKFHGWSNSRTKTKPNNRARSSLAQHAYTKPDHRICCNDTDRSEWRIREADRTTTANSSNSTRKKKSLYALSKAHKYDATARGTDGDTNWPTVGRNMRGQTMFPRTSFIGTDGSWRRQRGLCGAHTVFAVRTVHFRFPLVSHLCVYSVCPSAMWCARI